VRTGLAFDEEGRKVVIFPFAGRWWGFGEVSGGVWSLSVDGFRAYSEALEAAERWGAPVEVRIEGGGAAG
jgi:hypothetical protein